MKPRLAELWSRLEPLLDEALDLPPESRPAFIEEACSGDPELHQALLKLLAGAESAQQALQSGASFALPLVGSVERRSSDADVLPPGTSIGPFVLLRELGSGGMGVVYLAERSDPHLRQQVALKLVRHAPGQGRQLRQRFMEERQILASLHHPGIATLHDGGITADGDPWLAMEHVEGLPLDRYADAKALGVSERLRLFLSVCDAVQYAHQHLVVHRDLKPSNILVTSDATVKLLDFGIAKLLDSGRAPEAATLTRAGTQPFTPEYASPEQVLGQSVSTASDVYSLGVVLYELLTGTRPLHFADQPVAEWGTFIRTASVRAPSTIPGAPRGLRGDLDTIILKALRTEPERRYASAQQLHDDIRRHLDRLPVQARADSWSYRAGRFIRRHGVASAAAAAIALTLVVGVATTAWQARVARSEAAKAIKARDFLVGIFAESDPRQARGAQLTAREVLDHGAARVDSTLLDEPALRLDLTTALASIYLNIGLVHQSDSLAERAVHLAAQIYGTRDARYAAALDLWAGARAESGELAPAESLYALALSIATRPGAHPGDSLLADILGNTGVVLDYRGKYHDSEVATRKALAIHLRSVGPDHPLTAVQLVNLASVLLDEGDFAGADSAARAGVAIDRRALAPGHPSLMTALNNYASVLELRGVYDTAAMVETDVVAQYRLLYPGGHDDLATAMHNLAAYNFDMRRLAPAESLAREARTMFIRVDGPSHVHSFKDGITLAKVLLLERKTADALALLDSVATGLHQKVGDRHPTAIEAQYWRGRGLYASRRRDEAVRAWQAALVVARSALQPTHPRIGNLLTALGTAALERGQLPLADTLLAEARVLEIGRLAPGDPEIAVTTVALAQCRALEGRKSEAEALFVDGADRFEKNRFRAPEAAAARAALAGWQARWGSG